MNVMHPPQPVLDKRGEPRVRRFEEQRWLIDNIIRANGIDWDQPRSLYLAGPCGNEANADFAGIRERVKKMADIGPAFEAVARRREAKANAAEEAGHKVTARDNYFIRTTRPTSRSTTTNARAMGNTPRWPTIAWKRCGCRSGTRPFPPGSTCRRATAAGASRR
jgi:hypothetical protein